MTISTFIFVSFTFALLESCGGQLCTQEGFFRNPEDCSKFYRCVDLWQNSRHLTVYNFDCPAGTVFDETVSVCNWPHLAPPCDGGIATAAPEVSTTGSESGTVVDNGESIILTPSFSFQCSGEGIFEHKSDCSKFWICEADGGNNLESQLYICPDNYWFDNQRLRCVRKETVSCSKKPDLTKIHLEPQGVKLRLSDLDSFFSRFSFSSIISA